MFHWGRHVRVAGWHRLEAFKHLGKSTIPVIMTDAGDLDRRLWEIDENLIRPVTIIYKTNVPRVRIG